ncbi:hypothetical protein PAMC26577_14265 [Caballeronia sordidicola]|uniref:Uncharacterized protein n=1 Tax=Caballeronia sordidicola TaxID=196367 RepID=A0A242MUP1_CABSO|nr:hypothetical protein PAMC26577_14265 [Caballeronia sordidicola]
MHFQTKQEFSATSLITDNATEQLPDHNLKLRAPFVLFVR